MDMKSFYANEKPKTKRKGFSLVEMMVVMLLIAVVLAASAPMITRKVSRERSDKIFDMLGTDPNNAVEYVKGRNQRIFMNGRKDGYVGIVETGVNIPTNSVLFGQNILFPFNYVTKETSANNLVGIAFGTSNYLNSVAIGYNATAPYKNTVVLADTNTTVYIPGNLVVNHAALIGRNAGRNDNLYFRPYAQEDGRHFAVLNAGDWKGEDSNVSLDQDDTNDDKLAECRANPCLLQTLSRGTG